MRVYSSSDGIAWSRIVLNVSDTRRPRVIVVPWKSSTASFDIWCLNSDRDVPVIISNDLRGRWMGIDSMKPLVSLVNVMMQSDSKERDVMVGPKMASLSM